jgi:hypothetical protein
MITTLIRGAALVAAIGLAGMPAISPAATAYTGNQTTHANFSTSISPLFGFGAPWTGTLQLTFNPDGIVNGYYRPDDNMNYIPVTGGRNGQDIWLDIGERGQLHITGTLQNDKIIGTALNERSDHPYKFSAGLLH